MTESRQEHRNIDSASVSGQQYRTLIDTSVMSATKIKVTKVEFYAPDMQLKDMRVGAVKSVETTEYEREYKEAGVSVIDSSRYDYAVVKDSVNITRDTAIKTTKEPHAWISIVVVCSLLFLAAKFIIKR